MRDAVYQSPMTHGPGTVSTTGRNPVANVRCLEFRHGLTIGVDSERRTVSV